MGKPSIIRDRYGIMQYRMPTLDEVNRHVPTLTNHYRSKLNLSLIGSLILNTIINYPNRTKKIKQFKRVPLDYKHELSIRTNPQSLEQLTHRTFIRKLIYFYLFPERYNNNFEDFCIPWITESLFIMRKSIMKQMIHRKEIPLIFDYGSISHPLYNYPTSMSIPDTISLSHTIHSILEPTLAIYSAVLSKHNIILNH